MDNTSETNNDQQFNTRNTKRGHGHKMTDSERSQAQSNFLQSYASNGNILVSCQCVGINRSTFYDWQEKDEEFSFRFHQADRDFADTILAEFVQRARDGYLKPVVSMGKVVYEDVPVLDKNGFQVIDEIGRPLFERKPLMERVVSDRLLELAIKKHHPEYREKQQIDTTVTNMNANMQQLYEVIEKALAPFPEARIALAHAIAEVSSGKQ